MCTTGGEWEQCHKTWQQAPIANMTNVGPRHTQQARKGPIPSFANFGTHGNGPGCLVLRKVSRWCSGRKCSGPKLFAFGFFSPQQPLCANVYRKWSCSCGGHGTQGLATEEEDVGLGLAIRVAARWEERLGVVWVAAAAAAGAISLAKGGAA